MPTTATWCKVTAALEPEVPPTTVIRPSHPPPVVCDCQDVSADGDVPATIDPRLYDAVLFDLDGVLTDTASVHFAAWKALFDAFLAARPPRDGEDHSPFTEADYRHTVDGKPRADGLRDFLASRGISLPEGDDGADDDDTIRGLGNHKQRLFVELLAGRVTGFYSTGTLVRQLHDAGINTAVYSSSRNCADVLRAAGLDALFPICVDGVAAAELGLAGKPDPAVIVTAADRLGAQPDRCVVIDDGVSGMAAGRAGGFGLVIGVSRDGYAKDLLVNGADLVIGDLADVVVRVGDRRISALPDALASAGLLDGVTAARPPAIFVDFDGMLPDLDPGAATLPSGTAEALRALSAVCQVAVLSGRDLTDIRTRIGLPGLWYAGTHGLEFAGPDGSHHQCDVAPTVTQALEAAAETLHQRLKDVPEILLEHSRFAVTIRYRGVALPRMHDITLAMHDVGHRYNLRVVHGRKVVQLLPNIDWGKGKTVNRILELMADDEAILPIFVGDDLTDEDAFDTVAHNGIGMIVRHAEDENRFTAARFSLDGPERVTEFIEHLATQLTTAHETERECWSVAFDDYQPQYERLREVLCGVGNGYLATRGCAPEAPAGALHYPGTYIAGVYNRLVDDVAGKVVDNESIVNLPNWLSLTFRLNGGEWFDIDRTELLTYRQTVDLRHAEFTREVRFRDPAGRITAFQQRRFASMHDPHLCALQTIVHAENWSGTIEFRSAIDARVCNAGVERYRALSDRHLTGHNARETSAGGVLVETQTAQSRITAAVATRTAVWLGGQPISGGYRFFDEMGRAGHDVAVELATGQSVTVEKTAAYFTGRDPAVSEPGEEARRRLGGSGRYDELRGMHRVVWGQVWEAFNLHLAAEAEVLQIIRLDILHLLQAVSTHTVDLDAGVPARGLHGEAYRGHVFWDELFIIPVLNLRLPAVSRALLQYRYRRLPEARRAAAAAGYAGAMFPWQSGSDGREESQQFHLNPLSGKWNPDPSARAHHIGIAIAYNVWQYYQVTADLKYLIDYGAEIIVEIARFWVSRVSFDAQRDRYEIRGVIGPDEFHTGRPGQPYDGIDNNAYTNVMAVWVIMRAIDALDALPLHDRLDLLDRLGLRGTELARWDDVSRRMFVPFHDGIISQFEGYEKLRELAWDTYRERYGDIRRLDRILDAENDSANNYQLSKQADVLMLFYLLSADELRHLLARLGYRFPPDAIPKTIDYYLNRTSHGSTLSPVVHSWVLARGNRDQAMSYFRQVLKSDVADAPGGASSEGIHLAAMAGSVDLLQRCFSGLETRGGRLVLGPMWPESAGTLGFSIWYRGHRLHLRIHGRTAQVSADPSDAAPIEVECRGRVQRLEAGATIHIH